MNFIFFTEGVVLKTRFEMDFELYSSQTSTVHTPRSVGTEQDTILNVNLSKFHVVFSHNAQVGVIHG